MDISVVIITKNEEHIIGHTLKSLEGLTDDIVIVDSGSTDETLNICRQFNATVIEPGWNGYGANKNMGNQAAKYDWIFSLDADESIDLLLKQSISQLSLENDTEVFEVQRKNFFINKCIHHGEWGSDRNIRLFNRKHMSWNNAAVHENLLLTAAAKVSKLKGNLLHYTVHSLVEYKKKTIDYAKLNAQKYFDQGKKSTLLKQYISPVFSFFQNYFFKLGFLDGKEGLLIARTTARYTYLKYSFLNELNKIAKT